MFTDLKFCKNAVLFLCRRKKYVSQLHLIIKNWHRFQVLKSAVMAIVFDTIAVQIFLCHSEMNSTKFLPFSKRL